MYLSQLILIALILFFLIYIFYFRDALLDRLVYLVLMLAGIIVVLFPDLSTSIANLIGIGRGADLIFYAFIMYTLFNNIAQVSQIKKIEHQITVLVRKRAIAEAIEGSSSPEKDN
ncbi:MAG: DUF2304 domain-containing protein [Chloroflexi bacterium]|nr:DUF2304 domain-containing protein [Chloroflexota bacterium]